MGDTADCGGDPRVVGVNEVWREVNGPLLLWFGSDVVDGLGFLGFVLEVVIALLLLFELLYFVFLDVDCGVGRSFEDTFVNMNWY